MGVVIPLASRVNPAESQLTKRDPANLSGAEWPPRSERERLDAYAANRLLFEGDHFAVLSGKHNAVHDYEYISINLPKNIVTIVADLLFGEDLTLVYPDETPDAAKEKVDEIWERNDMQALLFEGALDTGYAGDGVWTVGREADGESGKAKIRTHPADTWFPEQNEDDVRDILRHRLAWVKKYTPEGGKELQFLRVVVHEKGRVLHQLYRLKDGKVGAAASPDEWAYFYETPPDEVQEGLEGEFLLEHIPNFRTARAYLGTSEYKGSEDLFAVINGTATQIDGILQRHSDPMLSLPADVWDTVTNGGKRMPEREKLAVISQGGVTGNKPEFITWDGKLSDNLAFMDVITDQIAVVSETAPQLLARGEWGGDLSGIARKILLIRTLAKVRRKRRYYDTVIPRLLEKAQRMEGVTDPIKVKLGWEDGLPDDVLERLEVADRRLANGTESHKGAIKTLDNATDAEAESKLEEIEDDGQTEAEAVSRQASQRPKPVIQVSANMGDVE